MRSVRIPQAALEAADVIQPLDRVASEGPYRAARLAGRARWRTARRLLEVGHTVFVGARDADRGRRTAGELGAIFLDIDPTSDASVAGAAGRVRSEYGRLDVLASNAGTAEPRVSAAGLTADQAMQGSDSNVFGPIRVTHAFLPPACASDHSRIVNVPSGAGRSPPSSPPEALRTL